MPTLLGTSPALEAVRKAIAQVASTDATVLIHGETSTGKKLEHFQFHYVVNFIVARARRPCYDEIEIAPVARSIHEFSLRKNRHSSPSVASH